MKTAGWIAGVLALIALVVGIVALSRAGGVQSSVSDSLESLRTQVEDLATEVSSLSETVGGTTAGPDATGGTPAPFANAAEMSDEELADAFFALVNAQAYPYAWNYETEPPAGFYTSTNPAHGAVLRAFMNPIAYNAVQRGSGTFPPGSIFVKENHAPGDADIPSEGLEPVPGFAGDLASLTLMVKLEGYNPEAGDWFWSKHQPDGSIDAAGTPDGCIDCHQQAEDNDWVFDADVTSAAN